MRLKKNFCPEVGICSVFFPENQKEPKYISVAFPRTQIPPNHPAPKQNKLTMGSSLPLFIMTAGHSPIKIIMYIGKACSSFKRRKHKKNKSCCVKGMTAQTSYFHEPNIKYKYKKQLLYIHNYKVKAFRESPTAHAGPSTPLSQPASAGTLGQH